MLIKKLAQVLADLEPKWCGKDIIYMEEEASSSYGKLVAYIHIYIHIFPNSAMEVALEQQLPIVMNTFSIYVLASKYHSLIKGISPPWRNR